MARFAVDEADASRLAYIYQIFSSLGFSPVEARARRCSTAWCWRNPWRRRSSCRRRSAKREARDSLVERLLTA